MAGNHRSGNRPNNKSTKAELERRYDLAGAWILENPDARARDFVAWAMAEFGVQKDMALKHRQRAKKLIGKVEADSLESARRISNASLLQMLEKAVEKGDVKLALSIRQELNKINGLYTED